MAQPIPEAVTPRSRSMFSAVGPERRCRAMRSSSRSTRPVLRSRKVRRTSPPWSAASKTPPRDALVMARPPVPPPRWQPAPAARERHGHVRRQHPAEAHADGLLNDDDLLGVLECVPDGIDREGPEGGDADRADPVSGGALGIHDVLNRPQHRAHGHDHHVGVGTPVRVHQATRVAPEGLGELRPARRCGPAP